LLFRLSKQRNLKPKLIMKTIRLLFLFVAISAVTLYSCSDSDPIDNNATTQKSIALRTAVNELKKANGLTNRTVVNPFCFEFVYPITLSLSNGTNVTVTSFDGLVSLLIDESANLYVEGIAFPFQVTMQGAVSTIDDEDEFIALLINCGFSTWNDDLDDSYCFDLVFPISVTTPNGTFEINSTAEFTNYLNASANGQVQINFPVSALYQGAVLTINNIYEAYDLINNCDDCACTFEYEPVCVNTPNGTLTFGNMCHALCSGYTQNDIVACNPANQCNITNLTVAVGACTNAGYALTLNFAYDNAGGTQFEVRNGNNFLVGTYPLSALPVTIESWTLNGQGADYLTVTLLNGTTTCTATQQWATPDCGGPEPCSVCTADFDPVCVQTATGIQQFTNECWATCAGFTQADFIECGVAATNFGTSLGVCFTINYPAQIMNGGEVITVNDNGTTLQYWFPAQAAIPNFVYPVTVSIDGGNTMTVVNNTQEFLDIVNDCI
jgi:hypothetical protein